MRRANPGDINAIIELERLAASAAHWPRQQYENVFVTTEKQLRCGRFAWVVEDDRDGRAKQAGPGTSQVVAFLVARRVDLEWELENIVVADTVRRQGAGKLLLDEFLAFAYAHEGRSVSLEVRESNKVARALYQKFGFLEAGMRKNYYSNPGDAAVIYRLTPIK